MTKYQAELIADLVDGFEIYGDGEESDFKPRYEDEPVAAVVLDGSPIDALRSAGKLIHAILDGEIEYGEAFAIGEAFRKARADALGLRTIIY